MEKFLWRFIHPTLLFSLNIFKELKNTITRINPGASDAAIKEAYEWALQLGGTGIINVYIK